MKAPQGKARLARLDAVISRKTATNLELDVEGIVAG
jgi:hypothetical protein